MMRSGTYALALLVALVFAACPESSPAEPDGVTPTADADASSSGDATPDGSADADAGADVPPPEPKNACLALDEAPPYQISAKASLRWKRAMALEQDLLGALQLEPEEACGEVGFPGVCFGLHLVPLGGNEPVVATMYEPLPAPAASTALAVDRVIIAACGAAVDRDSSVAPVVFQDFDLTADAVTADSKGLDALVTKLYQRFLARDPETHELDILRTLAAPVDGAALSARDFAKLACYAVASTTEFLFH